MKRKREEKAPGEVTRTSVGNTIEEAMRSDEQDKTKMDTSDERMTHRIAKEIEKAERKRKIDPADQEDAMEDTGARGSQEEQEGEAPKRVRFSEELEVVEPDSVDVEVALSGGAHGAAVQGDKRKRKIDCE